MRKRTLGLFGASIALASVAWLACGGSDGASSLLSPAPDSGDVPDGSGVVDNGQGDGGSDGSTDDAAQDASDGAPAPEEAGGGDGGINPPDAGPGGSTTILSCGSTTCAIPADNCCVTRVGDGGGGGRSTSFGCAATCSGPDAGLDTAALKCSGQSNCAAGTVCCVRQTGNNGAASDCQPTCNNNQAQLCALAAGDAGGCVGSVCSSNNIGDWALPPTYATCGGKGN